MTSSSNASRNTELAALYVSAASAANELARLQLRIAELEGREVMAPGQLPVVATSQSQPVFPIEVLGMVGGWLDPGTSELLELAFANKQLFALLYPHFLSTVCDEALDHPSFAKFMEMNEHLLRRHVQNLFLPFDSERALQLVKVCSGSLRHLNLYGFSASTILKIRRFMFPNVRRLEINRVSGQAPPWLPLLFPRLEVLEVNWCKSDSSFALFWPSLDEHCMDLKYIRLFGTDGDAEALQKLPNLVAKIGVLEVQKCSVAGKFCALGKFAPSEITIPDYGIASDTHIRAQDWDAICRLESLKTLEITWLGTHHLLRGFPPNIEKFRCPGALPCLLTELQQQTLRAKIPATLRNITMDFMIANSAELDVSQRHHRKALLAELLFWDTLNKPGHWMKLFWTDETGKYADKFRQDLWNKSLRMAK